MQRRFHVQAVWDDEDRIWFSESDIRGLNIEAETLEEFENLVSEFAAELIVTNHYSEDDLTQKDLRDLIPSVMISQKSGRHPEA